MTKPDNRTGIRRGNALHGRQRFRCTVCGLEVEGRESPDGTKIIPYDRAGYDGSPVRPFRCVDSPLCVPGPTESKT